MSMSLHGRTFWLHSTKHDGSLHYRYPLEVVQVWADCFAGYLQPGTPVESYRGGSTFKTHALMLCWRNRPYNLYVHWSSDWQASHHYVNIATPASWDEGTLRFVDLDLDLVWHAGEEEAVLDDEDEFEHHCRSMRYPAPLVKTARGAVEMVQETIRRRIVPFDGRLYDWRPGQPIDLSPRATRPATRGAPGSAANRI